MACACAFDILSHRAYDDRQETKINLENCAINLGGPCYRFTLGLRQRASINSCTGLILIINTNNYLTPSYTDILVSELPRRVHLHYGTVGLALWDRHMARLVIVSPTLRRHRSIGSRDLSTNRLCRAITSRASPFDQVIPVALWGLTVCGFCLGMEKKHWICT